MPSFDTVSEVDEHELSNAIDQASREISTRFDFKGSDAKVTREESNIRIQAKSEFQLDQVYDILITKMSKRGIDVMCMDRGKVEEANMCARQQITLRQGIDKDSAKKMVKLIKDSKIKVQASIQGEKLRVTGKKRDDLQNVMSLLKDSNLGIPLQFNNFRD
ncbi:MAG: YajQ family cyclic di-GMP-binding protein [Gammaproteobacteria bacterium]|nr:YajQ family cyclic di-GMP-binding protein [Gammaproteobacteria bacterium]MDH3608864.1 YajQ family cyclic di-GMP-binding protein [Gammaproteobacteria bacterium]NNC68746.1 YajQ family cyclic di-GMP-binding protein [Gammaproteobacteria bacterium]